MSSLSEELQRYSKQGMRSFHTPGHKGRREFFFGLDFPAHDLTELPGLDTLHAPVEVIKEAQQRCARIFGAEESFFLINGGTAGNQAMLLALPQAMDKTVWIERQAHRSVIAGLVLSGLKPAYLQSVVHPDFNLPLGLNSSQSISWEKAQAVLVTYPSYYGTLPNLKEIVTQRDGEGRQVPVLVDQAHGSHYLNSLFPPSALVLGADLVLNSAHKTLSALTQAALLHRQGERVDRNKLVQGLNLLQSTSPSYLLMASLERAGEFALEHHRWTALHDAVKRLHVRVGGIMRLLEPEDAGTYGIDDVDWSKILVNIRPLGIDAPQAARYLRQERGIEPEFWDEENILFILGIGNTPEDVDALAEGLVELGSWAVKNRSKICEQKDKKESFNSKMEVPSIPRQHLTPREAFMAPKSLVPLRESIGRIVGETISPYPPGIPWIVAGEEMSMEIMEGLMAVGQGLQGWREAGGGQIQVIEEG